MDPATTIDKPVSHGVPTGILARMAPGTGTKASPQAVSIPGPIHALRERVEDTLVRFLADERAALGQVDPGALSLLHEVERVVRSGGKRLRPAFCVLGHLAGGGRRGEPILRVAAALELLHTFALIHDDVMDASTVRRGVPTSHVHMAKRHRAAGRPGDSDRFGLSAAILAGDMALVLADRLFLASEFEPVSLLRAQRRYTAMLEEMAAGQFMDVWGEAPSDDEDAGWIASLKTGSYTVEGPLHVGAILAGASLEVLAALSRYGEPLGQAFQVRDDLLGIVGDESGGSPAADLARGRPSVLLEKARSLASPTDRRFLDHAVGRSGLSADDRDRIVRIVHESGAVAAATAFVNGLVDEAVSALSSPPLSAKAVEGLRVLARGIALPAG
jgi:geranylgeranyl diphosphate synthase type I